MYGELVLTLFMLIMCMGTCSTAPIEKNAEKKTSSSDETTHLVVQLIRSADDFKKKNNPEKEIEAIERKSKNKETIISSTSKNTDTTSKRLYDYVPALYASRYYPSSARRGKRIRRGRRRLKRGSTKVNRDSIYISEYPTTRRIYRAINKVGFCLRVHLDGRVDGTQDINDERGLLSFESHGPSIFRIKGVVSNRYLVIGSNGLPTAEESPNWFNSLFRLTHEENSWDTLASYKYYYENKFDMLVGITKDAIVKKPWKAAPGQHATQFLLIPPL